MSPEVRITSFRQSTSRICRYCHKSGREYNVIEGEPTEADLALGHDRQAGIDMDRHERHCEKNPHRSWWPF